MKMNVGDYANVTKDGDLSHMTDSELFQATSNYNFTATEKIVLMCFVDYPKKCMLVSKF